MIKVIYNGSMFENRWRKDFLSTAKDAQGNEAEYYCPFNICSTNDGGLLIGGNNELEGDNYEFIKLNLNADTNSPCLNVDQPSANITGTVVWNTPKTVKGTITVKSGATLTIQNTTITFANTYTTNDLADILANSSSFNPTKIVVEIRRETYFRRLRAERLELWTKWRNVGGDYCTRK